MAHCKVVFVGAGSYVFGPAPIRDLLERHRLTGLELVLVDPNQRMLDLLSGVARAAARKHGLDTVIRTATNAAEALDGADFVICAAAIDLRNRFALDCAVIARLAPGHLVTEFGGVHGISMSLRQIAMIEQLAAEMRSRCPNATLLNVANPLPRVCQAAHEAGIRTVGFCSASLSSYAMVWQLLHGGDELQFPFEPASSELRLLIAGLNHHTFVLDARDQGGADLMPTLVERVRSGATTGSPVAERFLVDHRAMLAVHDGHTRDFFAPLPGATGMDHISHGDGAAREARLKLLADIGAGHADPAECFEPQAWEYPGDYVAALAYGRVVRFHSLNQINDGQIPQLPRNVFVETAATGADGTVSPARVDLPGDLVPYCLRTAAVTDLLVRAARTRSLALLRGVVELDPTILDKRAGWNAVKECVTAHRDLIGNYN